MAEEYSDEDFLEDDYGDLSDSDKTALLVIGYSNGIMKPRLQKLSLIYDMVYGEGNPPSDGAYFLGGYSDDLDGSAENMVEDGIASEHEMRYELTPYGRKLLRLLEENDGERSQRMKNIVRCLKSVDDRHLIGLTYRFWPALAKESVIAEAVARTNRNAVLNGRKLDDWSRDEFADDIRRGAELTGGDAHDREM
ncbi:hypothetical protein AUQ37_03450 [Candidatus Methanomethylophilus sp. 1R26]|uniref:hypothetical protein n=1 Tax=Candidatus Methanomethylophilus sp. 1R26 TaxID=1769296 RepID=UPI0007363FC0|nr:hypothetical protein [Candidatus Methanomethylophilus sp. 1R26]KUE73164.1 hypothetical protein AUQ37_03450 [Candidatus Methanomethylophilus sp. 1R26]TQS81462.1 MAG: hypothetical protein A3Q59_05295 [Methanomethylophilus alvi]